MATFFKPPRFLLRDRPAARAQSTTPIQVICYRCAKQSSHSPFAETGSCPHCAGQLRFGDIHITKGHWGTSIQTTGSVTIDQHAQVNANLILCSGNLFIAGQVHAMCISGGQTTISQTAEIKGGIQTPRLNLQPGATLQNCLIKTHASTLGIIDVDAAIRSAPGKGQAGQIEPKPIVSMIGNNKNIAARIYPGPDGPRQAQVCAIS